MRRLAYGRKSQRALNTYRLKYWLEKSEMKKINENVIYVAILLILSLLFFKSLLNAGVILNNGHYANDLTFLSYNIKESMKNNQLPLWTPYFYSGQPLLAIPENYMFDLNFLFILFFGDIYLAMNLSLIAYLFLAGLGMFFLVAHLTESKKAALIASIVYMFNGFMHSFILRGHINILEGYSLIPFIFLFTHKALKTRDWIFYSMITGIFLALQILAGSMIIFFYTLLIIGAYIMLNLIDQKFMSILIKAVIVVSIIAIISFSFASIKILPVLEFTKLSSRGSGVSFNEFLGEPIDLNDIFGIAVTNLGYGGLSSAVGVVGFALLILGFANYRKKIVVFSFVLIAFSLLFASNTFAGDLMYKLPGFNKMRHVERSLVLLAFAGSVMSAYGFLWMSEKLKNKLLRHLNYFFIFIVLAIATELVFLQHFPASIKHVSPDEIKLLDHISKDNSKFRVMNIALKDIIGASGYNYYSQKGISDAKGGGGIWVNDYVTFLAIGYQYLNSNILGVLNVKYIISDNELNFDNMKLVNKFNECNECPTREAFGPYLYERKSYAPRFFIAPKSMLILGESEQTKNLVYTLLLKGIDPKSIVLMEGTNIDDYSSDFLDKFDYIFLLQGSINQGSLSKLDKYKKNGGTLIPDILTGQNSVPENLMASILNMTLNPREIEIEEYSSNKIVLNLNGEKWWLVASERFAYFPGWKATINGKDIPIHKADIVISSMYLDGQKGKLVFEYKPDSYKTGKLISIVSSLVILSYFAYYYFNIYFKRGDSNKA